MSTLEKIRPMRRADLDVAVAWAAAEGWNPGLADADAFWAADPGGFLLAERDGAPIGCISCVRTGTDFGFIGFYIVRPDCRGQGEGIALWRAAMARLQGRLVGLDGVVAQQENYRKSGFILAWRNLRYEAAAPRLPAPPSPAAGLAAVDARALPFDAVLACDRAGFPAPRESFLRAWLALPGLQARALVRDGRVSGWGAVRPARAGWKIGPLIAEGPAEAEALLAALGAVATPERHPSGDAASGSRLVLDVPEPNATARALAEAVGMAPAFETARMYTGAAPAVDLPRVFGITSFELG